MDTVRHPSNAITHTEHLTMALLRLAALADTFAAIAMTENPAERVLDTDMLVASLGLLDQIAIDLRRGGIHA